MAETIQIRINGKPFTVEVSDDFMRQVKAGSARDKVDPIEMLRIVAHEIVAKGRTPNEAELKHSLTNYGY